MQLNRKFTGILFASAILLCVGSQCLPPLHASPQTRPATGISLAPAATNSSALDPLVGAALDHFYNMDYDRSVQEFEKVLAILLRCVGG